MLCEWLQGLVGEPGRAPRLLFALRFTVETRLDTPMASENGSERLERPEPVAFHRCSEAFQVLKQL